MSLPEQVRREIVKGGQVFAPLIDMLRNGEAGAALEDVRRAYLAVKAEQMPPPGIDFAAVTMGGVPATLATPENAAADRTIFYLHGGGYASGGADGSRAEVGRLAQALSARAYVPDYRLAPEHPYPVPLDDVMASYRGLLDTGTPAASIVFAGESAGGAMVISAMVRARDAGLPLPAGALAISPWANLAHEGASMTNRDGIDPVVTRDALDVLARAYLGDTPRDHPEVSPVHADLRGLPPVMIQIGEDEVMLSDAIRLAERLADAKVRMTLEVWPGMFHVWHHFAAILSEGQDAIESAAAFLDGRLAT